MNRYDIALGKMPPPKPKNWNEMTPDEQAEKFQRVMDKGPELWGAWAREREINYESLRLASK